MLGIQITRVFGPIIKSISPTEIINPSKERDRVIRACHHQMPFVATAVDSFDALPDELLLEIFSSLPLSDALRARGTNRRFERCCQERLREQELSFRQVSSTPVPNLSSAIARVICHSCLASSLSESTGDGTKVALGALRSTWRFREDLFTVGVPEEQSLSANFGVGLYRLNDGTDCLAWTRGRIFDKKRRQTIIIFVAPTLPQLCSMLRSREVQWISKRLESQEKSLPIGRTNFATENQCRTEITRFSFRQAFWTAIYSVFSSNE